jgi:hypothetical protein
MGNYYLYPAVMFGGLLALAFYLAELLIVAMGG